MFSFSDISLPFEFSISWIRTVTSDAPDERVRLTVSDESGFCEKDSQDQFVRELGETGHSRSILLGGRRASKPRLLQLISFRENRAGHDDSLARLVTAN
jgi:hypothetical protein